MLDQLLQWMLIAALSALFNVTPVLAPPTWAMLAWFQTRQEISLLVVVVLGAVGSTAGRVALALVARKLGTRIIPARRRDDLEALVETIQERKRFSLPVLSMFAIGPVPKSLLFMAAGIARAPLWPGAIVFGVSRGLIYLGTLAAVDVTFSSFGDIFTSSVGGPLIVAAQIASVVGLFVVLRMDLRSLKARALAPILALYALIRRPQTANLD